MDKIVNIITAHGAFGASSDDTLLELFLRNLSVSVAGNDYNWVSKYGTNFENETFMMHEYCWCENDECPWCGVCNCPESANHYFVDGKEVSADEYKVVYFDMGYSELMKYKFGSKEYKDAENIFNKKIKIRSARCKFTKDDVCDYCTGKGMFERYAAPGNDAPNFWHKSSGLKVWWYKYIGRDMKVMGGPLDFVAALKECIDSLQKPQEAE